MFSNKRKQKSTNNSKNAKSNDSAKGSQVGSEFSNSMRNSAKFSKSSKGINFLKLNLKNAKSFLEEANNTNASLTLEEI